MEKLTVKVDKGYDIYITKGYGELKTAAKPLEEADKIAVVTDETVKKLFAEEFIKELSAIFPDKEIVALSVAAGEKSKNGENFLRLSEELARRGFQRKDAVAALGGGVVGDLAGFVASAYMRGIKLFAVPTTFLSAIDSSVGGKTAIDLKEGKNLCGSFYQPHAVYINLDFLKTLPEKEIKNGYGEAVKYALLSRSVTAEDLSGGITETLIKKCLGIKKEVVEKDEKESGLRRILNLGHTVGHAIETLSSYELSHGECVAKGIAAAIEISAKIYGLSSRTKDEMLAVLNAYPFDLSPIFKTEDICKEMLADKKSDGSAVNFVTLKGVGEPCAEKIAISEIEKILKGYYGS